jgi:hypothetical protein
LVHITLISCCSASKDDSIPIPDNASRFSPAEYLMDNRLIKRLEETRSIVFKDTRTMRGTKTTYAFDLYTHTGFAYRNLTPTLGIELKQSIISNKLSWLFLSAGYGIIHALEPVTRYQATFNRTIAYQNNIPYTTKQWKDTLGEIIDSAVTKLNPDWLFFFGSKDYSSFFKDSKTWKKNERPNIRLFESSGSSGPHWLSPLIGKLAGAILHDQVTQFSKSFDRFTKQELSKTVCPQGYQ